ncbi:hypothetical protein TNCV_4206291 [Trichonephila clavipes]|nr:hypothetical protein TNCV_4206291 [Trichonephila clavipes]
MDKCVQMLDKELWRLGPDGSGDAGKKTRDRSPAREGKRRKSPGSRKHERKALVGMDWKRALRKRSESGIGGERKERR